MICLSGPEGQKMCMQTQSLCCSVGMPSLCGFSETSACWHGQNLLGLNVSTSRWGLGPWHDVATGARGQMQM